MVKSNNLLLVIKMAEVVTKVGDSIHPLGYKDGDILCAFTDRHISCVHAQNICNSRHIGFKLNGLREIDSLTFKMFSEFCQYKFERISNKEVRRVNLFTGQREIFSDQTDEYIDVDLFIQRRLKHSTHLIFGEVGNEMWFGGRSNFSQRRTNNLWQNISNRTGLIQAYHNLWPLGYQDIRDHFSLRINRDLTDLEAQELVEPEFEDRLIDGRIQSVMIKKRKSWLNRRDILAITDERDSKITDRNEPVDNRSNDVISTDIMRVR